MGDSSLPRPPAYHQPVFIPPPAPRSRRRSCFFRCCCCCCCCLLVVILLLVGGAVAFTFWLSPSPPSVHLQGIQPSSNLQTLSLSLSVRNSNVRQFRFVYRDVSLRVRTSDKDEELVAVGSVAGFSQGRGNTTELKVKAKVVGADGDDQSMKKKKKIIKDYKQVKVWMDCLMVVYFQGVQSGEFRVTWFCDNVHAASDHDDDDGQQHECTFMFNFANKGWAIN